MRQHARAAQGGRPDAARAVRRPRCVLRFSLVVLLVPERLTEPSSVRRLEDRAGEEVSEGEVSILGSVLLLLFNLVRVSSLPDPVRSERERKLILALGAGQVVLVLVARRPPTLANMGAPLRSCARQIRSSSTR